LDLGTTNIDRSTSGLLPALEKPDPSGNIRLLSIVTSTYRSLGLYIKLILEEVKDRPRAVVQEVYRKTS